MVSGFGWDAAGKTGPLMRRSKVDTVENITKDDGNSGRDHRILRRGTDHRCINHASRACSDCSVRNPLSGTRWSNCTGRRHGKPNDIPRVAGGYRQVTRALAAEARPYPHKPGYSIAP